MELHMNYKDFLCDDLFICWRMRPTEELDIFWEKYINDHEELRDQFNLAIAEFHTIRTQVKTSRPDEDRGVQIKIQDERFGKRKKKRKLRFIYPVAAAAIAALVLISTVYFISHREKKIPQEVASTGRVMSENNVQLFTGENLVALDNNTTLNLSEKKNSAIIISSETEKEVVLNTDQMNKLIVPFGKRSSLVLADGSTVYLNSGTEMEFPATFGGQTREVRIEGEVFIEVVNQPNKPFIVHTPSSRIIVYGTSFNISSYTDEPNESVVLIEGSVEVVSGTTSLLLKPNEMAEINKGSIHSKKVNVADHISWREGYLQLNKTPLNDVLKKIGRYYNVEFKYDPTLNLALRTCSGKLFLSDDLGNMLKVFSKMTHLTYRQEGDTTYYIESTEIIAN